MQDARIREAIALMNGFAERTGLSSERPQQRYLWTDAFAVCNLLGLSHATGDKRYTQLAMRLIDSVHHTLGRHRSDDTRIGWISGLSEREGEEHPTRGGLRIGKALSERGPDQVFDERLEWDRDGQYFHYLTKWMHALDQVTRATGKPQFNVWARELADTAHHAFVYIPKPGGLRRMYWKMSIDLKRPLVSSMGQHDPLDGYISYVQLNATTARLAGQGPKLNEETKAIQAMIGASDLATADPLGLGGLLIGAYRLEQLLRQGASIDPQLLEALLSAARIGLQYYAASGDLEMPAEYRLAFRELGLAIGLYALRLMQEAAEQDHHHSHLSENVRLRLRELMQYVPIGEKIVSFWRVPEHRQSSTWIEHRDINDVMLATSLLPEGFLVLSPLQ